MTNNKQNDVRVVPVELIERAMLACFEAGHGITHDELRAILTQPADQQGEPDFYEVSGNGVRPGLFYTYPDWAMEDPRYTVTPHWRSAAQPATAKVVLPERLIETKVYAMDLGGNYDEGKADGWNDCLDEVAKLNEGRV